MALSRAHDVLTRESWESAALRDIVEQAVAPFATPESGRFEVEGPKIRIVPRQALSLSMALNELATNASKYGALTTSEGKVRIAWSLDESVRPRRLHLEWSESGGPLVQIPQRRGFGSRLIERALASEMGGEVLLEFRPTGVICTIDTPI